MTHRHDGFECSNLSDYVDTKSWLAYEQNPYSTHWVTSSSRHREISLGYDILPPITRLQANTNIRLLHDATTPWCSKLGGCAMLPQPVQPSVVASSPAWLSIYIASRWCCLGSAIASITRQYCRQHDSAFKPCYGLVTSAEPSLAWLSSIITSMTHHIHRDAAKSPRQHYRQHDSTSTPHRGQVASVVPSSVWLNSIVSSMTLHLYRTMAKLSQ
jgi:hypothetical protein